MDDILEFRRRFPFRPFERLSLDGVEVEAVSYPWPHGGGAMINVRMVPGDPTTMETVDAASLSPQSKIEVNLGR